MGWLQLSALYIVTLLSNLLVQSTAGASLSRLEILLQKKHRDDEETAEKVFELINRSLKDFNLVALIASRLLNVLLACLVFAYFRQNYGNGFLKPLLQTLLVFFLSITFINITIIQQVVRKYGEKIIFYSASPLTLLLFVLRPVIVIFHATESAVCRIIGLEETANRRITDEEILNIVSDVEKEGGLHADEKEMIEGILDFKDTAVNEIMTPRTDMVSIDINTPIDEAVELCIESGYSRIPVFEKDRDHITGVLYVKDLLQHQRKEEQDKRLRSIIRPPVFIPETKKVVELLQEFKTRKIHFAVAVDEYGGTAGVITIEDIIEEIVGEIHDEYDTDTQQEITQVSPDVYIVEGRTHIDEIDELFEDIEIKDTGEFETIGGLVFDCLGRIPEVSETFEVNGMQCKILSVNERKIEKMMLSPTRDGEKKDE